MRRVVVTGMGIVSPIGNSTQEVLASLREAKSGVTRADKFAELGFRSQVQGAPDGRCRSRRRSPRHAVPTAAARPGAHLAMDSGDHATPASTPEEVSNPRTGILMGSGGPSTRTIVEAADLAREKGPEARRPLRRAEGDVLDGIGDARRPGSRSRGASYSISSACATSNHCIGNAYEMIAWGKQEVMFAGGCEELDWTLAPSCSTRWARCRPIVQRDSGARLARLRQEPRWFRHRRRRGRTRPSKTTNACQGARSPDLRRDRRLRLDLGRPRHGRALRRGRRTLHAHGARGHQGADRLHQPARHIDPGRRRQGDRGGAPHISAPATGARRSPPPSR